MCVSHITHTLFLKTNKFKCLLTHPSNSPNRPPVLVDLPHQITYQMYQRILQSHMECKEFRRITSNLALKAKLNGMHICLPLINTILQQSLVINIHLARLNNEHDHSTKNTQKASPSVKQLDKEKENKQTNSKQAGVVTSVIHIVPRP